MFHPTHTIGSRRRQTALLAAAVIGCAAGIAATRHRQRRALAAALGDAAVWRAEAHRDPLTGLPNRRAAQAAVNRRLAHADVPFLLALFDLDGFKAVNDTYGHPTGDDLLTAVAARLHVAVAPDGFVARLGGDEFLALLPDHGGDAADTLTPVLAALTQPVQLGAVTLRPRACAGVTSATGGAVAWRELIARADRALYRAKTNQQAVVVDDAQFDTSTQAGSRRPRVRRRDRQPHNPGGAPTAESDA